MTVAFSYDTTTKTLTVTAPSDGGRHAVQTPTGPTVGWNQPPIGEFPWPFRTVRYIKFQGDITMISRAAFAWYESLKELHLPDSVTFIDSQAFFNCTALEKIVFGANLTHIGNKAFGSLSSIEGRYRQHADDRQRAVSDGHPMYPAYYDAWREVEFRGNPERVLISPGAFEYSSIWGMTSNSSPYPITLPGRIADTQGNKGFKDVLFRSGHVVVPASWHTLPFGMFEGPHVTDLWLGPNITSLGNCLVKNNAGHLNDLYLPPKCGLGSADLWTVNVQRITIFDTATISPEVISGPSSQPPQPCPTSSIIVYGDADKIKSQFSAARGASTPTYESRPRIDTVDGMKATSLDVMSKISPNTIYGLPIEPIKALTSEQIVALGGGVKGLRIDHIEALSPDQLQAFTDSSIDGLFPAQAAALRKAKLHSTQARGDPYVTPVYGPTYKLPDRNGVYRYMSSIGSYAERFTIDADVLMLTRKQQADALRYMIAKDRSRFDHGQIVVDGFFFRNYAVTNCGEKILIDMEDNTINKLPMANMQTDHFTVSIGNKAPPLAFPYDQEMDETTYSVSIKTSHPAYGEIIIDLYKYENPQIRNSIQVRTSNALSHDNSKGFVMQFQDYKQFSIRKLGSEEDIPSFDQSKMPDTNINKVIEDFTYEHAGTISLEFLQQ